MLIKGELSWIENGDNSLHMEIINDVELDRQRKRKLREIVYVNIYTVISFIQVQVLAFVSESKIFKKGSLLKILLIKSDACDLCSPVNPNTKLLFIKCIQLRYIQILKILNSLLCVCNTVAFF